MSLILCSRFSQRLVLYCLDRWLTYFANDVYLELLFSFSINSFVSIQWKWRKYRSLMDVIIKLVGGWALELISTHYYLVFGGNGVVWYFILCSIEQIIPLILQFHNICYCNMKHFQFYFISSLYLLSVSYPYLVMEKCITQECIPK